MSIGNGTEPWNTTVYWFKLRTKTVYISHTRKAKEETVVEGIEKRRNSAGG